MRAVMLVASVAGCGRIGFDATTIDGARDGATASPASCVALSPTCGPSGASCCASSPVPGGAFDRSFDLGSDGMYTDASAPATVSDFRLDTYEVTVGRFRQFVAAGMGTQVAPPVAGAGTHPSLPTSGWDPTWNASLAADPAALIADAKCDATYQTWTDVPGLNEDMPINCISWFEAFAFCAWDGGYLPTEAEWNYAAAGGSEQRAYPWSNPPSALVIDCSFANYFDAAACANLPNPVGSESPAGDGKWGHADLAGNVWEWTLDWSATYATPCDDCADLTPASNRVFRGGSFVNDAPLLRGAFRVDGVPVTGSHGVGVRCARAP